MPGRSRRPVLSPAAGRRWRWPAGEEGSTIPLVLGFFLIGLVMVAGSVTAADAFARQRDLQSICDGTALAAANALDTRAARTQGLADSLPLAGVQAAAESYLAEDADRAGVSVRAELGPDGRSVALDCRRRSRLAFGALTGHRDGITQHARAHARSVTG